MGELAVGDEVWHPSVGVSLTGDNCVWSPMTGCPSAPSLQMRHYEANFWLPFMGTTKPVYAIPGNHDWYGALEEFAATFLEPGAARAAMHAGGSRQLCRLTIRGWAGGYSSTCPGPGAAEAASQPSWATERCRRVWHSLHLPATWTKAVTTWKASTAGRWRLSKKPPRPGP
jgi:hypothetical protein